MWSLSGMDLFMNTNFSQCCFGYRRKTETAVILEKQKKNRYRGFLDDVNGFGISEFSDTSNAPSLRVFELLYAIDCSTSDMLSFDVLLCYRFCYFHRF